MVRICYGSAEGAEYCTMPFSTGSAANVDSVDGLRVIGLTGGMGVGKSVVSGILRSLGHSVYDADSAAKSLYDRDDDLLEVVRCRFGDGILTPEGRLNRVALAHVVFADSSALNDLNALVHPAVARDFAGWRDGLGTEGVRLVFREAAILFESGSHRDCDAVWGVKAPNGLRIQRVRDRSGLAEAEVRQRMARQWSQEDVMAACDAVIVNDGVEPLVLQVLSLLDNLSPSRQRSGS
jgi:dephospho-CoA kinase